jgi:hypothetical protein
MKFPFERKEIITFLFSLAMVLLVLNIVISKIYRHNGKNFNVSGVNSDEIKTRFISALHHFGIKDVWIAEDNNELKQNDSLKYFYKVNVPKDLPVSLLLNEVSNSFEPGEVIYYSKETKVNGITNLYLVSGGFEKLTAEFVYNPVIQRPSCSIGFLVYGINTLSPADRDQLIKCPDSFTTVLLPSKESLEIIKNIKTYEKDYSIMLSTEISDLDYKLSSGYSPERLKMSIRSILGDFPDAAVYIYNNNSEFTSRSQFPFIKQEFEKRKVKFIDINKFILIDQKGTSLGTSFDLIINEVVENKTELIFISADHYLKLRPQISKYRKIGYKFINPSLALNEYLKTP